MQRSEHEKISPTVHYDSSALCKDTMTKVLFTLAAAKNYKIVSQASNICTWFLRDMVSQHWLYWAQGLLD